MRRWRVNAAENYSLAKGREREGREECGVEWGEVRQVVTASRSTDTAIFFFTIRQLRPCRMPSLPPLLLLLLLRFHLHAIRGCD